MFSDRLDKSRVFRRLMACASVAALAVPVLAAAQTQASANGAAADQSAIADIVVTAQRRSERLQDVPIAVAAVTSKGLVAKGIQNTLDLAQVVPALSFNSDAGATEVRLRGVGTTNFGPGVENPVAMYVDGVYIASTSGAFLNLSNIERVEVLKGPQGTLFGRNATGGLVQIITPDPSDTLKGSFKVGYANYETASLDGYITGPLAKGLSADLAVHYAHEGEGWGRNINTGDWVNRIDDDLVVRSKIKYEPGANLKFILAGDYSYMLGSRPLTLQEVPGQLGDFDHIYGVTNHGGFYDNAATFDPRAKIESGGVSLTSSIKLGGLELKSITAYRKTTFDSNFPLTRVPQDVLDFHGVPKWQQFSQELQLNGSTAKLKYTAGAYYFYAKDQYDPFGVTFGSDFAPIAFPQVGGESAISGSELYHSIQKTSSLSGYAQATYEFLPATNLTLGGRYTDELKKVSGNQSLAVTYPAPIGTVYFVPVGTSYLASGLDPRLHNTNFSYRIALDHKFSSDIMGYISYNTGFKSGGYNLTTPGNPAYQPEELKAIEVGLKTELFERRVRLNLAAYHYIYTNMQVNNFIITSTYIVNAGASKMDGIEADAEWRVMDGLTINAGLNYVNDRFTNFPGAGYNYLAPSCTGSALTGNSDTPCVLNAKGNKLPLTPNFTGNIGFSYEQKFGNSRAGVTGNLYHSSGWFGDFDNDPRTYQKAYELVNGSIYLEPGSSGLRLTVWAKNVFGVHYYDNLYVSSQQPTYQAGAPRTYGISVEKKF